MKISASITQQYLDELFFKTAEAGSLDDLELLLAQGANPKVRNSLPLRLAAKKGHADCVKFLIPVSDPTAQNSFALQLAVDGNRLECARLLIPVSNPAADRSRALRIAAMNGHAECAALLIPLSDPMDQSSVALRLASSGGHLECVKLLIPVSDHAAENFHALRAASENGHVECATLLIELCPLLSDPRPFYAAIEDGEATAAAFMLEREPRLASLVDLPSLIESSSVRGHVQLRSLLSAVHDKHILSACSPSPEVFNNRASSSRL